MKVRLSLGFAFLVLICGVLRATTIIPMSVERLTLVSSQVVRAHAVKRWSAWNEQHTNIYTYTQFQVEARLKGNGDAVIIVKQPGGSAEGYTQHVAGVHPWSSGETAVLFLRASSANDGTFVVAGLMQGDFRVRRTASGEMIADNGIPASARQTASEVSSFNPAEGSLSAYNGNRMCLNELERRVRNAVETK